MLFTQITNVKESDLKEELTTLVRIYCSIIELSLLVLTLSYGVTYKHYQVIATTSMFIGMMKMWEEDSNGL